MNQRGFNDYIKNMGLGNYPPLIYILQRMNKSMRINYLLEQIITIQ
ncbi:hypothetical protein BRYFOR_08646 [Marvinbryantia formatexigens DSM 14469]|uniref:Uncharacterized protein n=1 Tax=Marvinbryantia formatexigens DSM 14469 TaxID=478749 RepID=C6LJ12_9FIRM|nr:hypothetical protein BRYFOR_08646 [Marvinbryantia formatexigens DSM 14469]SDF50420.1 hypothetical protein SAMN05660368_00795 [Marvinbryantia formatexigens]